MMLFPFSLVVGNCRFFVMGVFEVYVTECAEWQMDKILI